jgi:hypothetical protein
VAEEAATDDEVEQQEVEQDEAAGEESGEEEEEELEQQIQEEGDCFATLSHRGMGSFAYISRFKKTLNAERTLADGLEF